jgi:hypothetical protein
MLIKIILVIFVFIFITTLVIKRFLYFRPSFSFVAPRENFQDIYEGNLHAWFKLGSDKVVLFCHGNSGNLTHRQDKLIEFIKMGLSVLIFDYSGYGHSKGVPTEQMCYANGDLFFNYLLRKGFKMENIIPYGESLGASVASYLARKYNLPKVVIESGLPGIKYLLKHKYPYLPLGYIFNEFDTITLLKGYKGNIMFLHCINDEIIPIQLFNGFLSSSIFIKMDGGHNNPIIPWEEVKKFIE